MKLKNYLHQHGLVHTARRVGVTPQRLHNWISRGVPIEKCAVVERVTRGAVTRQDLRPNDWQVIWPELLD